MRVYKGFAALLVASTVLGGVAYAADAVPQAPAPTQTKQEVRLERAVDKDVGRLSTDGAQALSDIQAARFAIFNAQTDQAKTFIHKAKDELQKAAKDDSVFMKAASELEAPMKAQPVSTDAKAEAKPADAGKVIAWLPVDSQMSLGEAFQATPEKIAAVTNASQHLKTDDRQGALEKLALADVDVQFATAVLPLDHTISDVNKAADLIDQGHYYEANAVLKDTTDQAMINVVDIYGQPYKAKTTKTAEAHTPSKTNTQPATKVD